MEEVWKPVKGYEGLYEISNLGSLKSLKKNRIIKPSLSKGYLRTVLTKEHIRKNKTIHQLVAQAFIPNPNNLLCVNHKNEIKTDNRVENLEWCDSKYNDNYGTRNKKIADSLSKKIDQFDKQGNFIKTWNSSVEIQRKTGINQSNVRYCCRNKRKNAGGYIWKYHNENKE